MINKKIIDRYWELRREIINTPPIYFWRLRKLFKEYEKIKYIKENSI